MESEFARKVQQAYATYAPRLVLYGRQWVEVETAEDCVQDVFVRLMLQRRWPHRLEGWLFKLVRNEVVNMVRHNSRQQRRAASVERQADWFQPDEKELVDVRAVQAAIAGLDEQVREVLMLRIWADLPYEDIAVVTGVSETTAFRRYREGLQQIEIEMKLAASGVQTRVSMDRKRIGK